MAMVYDVSNRRMMTVEVAGLLHMEGAVILQGSNQCTCARLMKESLVQ